MPNPIIWLGARTLQYPEGGGHFWAYLNWALGLHAVGCGVVWLEAVDPVSPPAGLQERVLQLRQRLAHHGLTDGVALCSSRGGSLPPELTAATERDMAESREADLLLNLAYDAPGSWVGCFRRAALVDIDPGLTQVWLSAGQMRIEPHHVYFSIGETVGRPGALFPDCGLEWHHTPPCVALEAWPVHPAPDDAPFTTVSHWQGREWVLFGDQSYPNDKRTGFLPFLGLPRRTRQPLELALRLAPDEDEERQSLRAQGWRVRESRDVSSTPEAYQRYLQSSRGEFSCAKPSCVRMQNAWLSDRTLCYLASGKPAVVQHTGPSRLVPDAAGLFRFRDLDEAAQHLERAAGDYAHQGRLARALAEEHFDARKVARRVLERALG